MTKRRLDLVHELQIELGWDPDFAAGAYREYKRWLHLRVQAGDFISCKLPPSRVVSLVWGMHRTWTLDYEKTCDDLGGFLHHYPPAMRMNMGREQAYAATVHLYKNTYREDPPSAYWGAAFCAYKPLSSDVEMPATEEPETEETNLPPPRAAPTSRRTSARRDSIQLRNSPVATKAKEKPANEPLTRRTSYSKRLQMEEDTDGEKPRTSQVDEIKQTRRGSRAVKEAKPNKPAKGARISKPAKPAKPGKPGKHTKATKPAKAITAQAKVIEIEEESDAEQDLTKEKGRRRLSGSAQLYVLRPLRPGEKRKRGRPSFSDYILLNDMNKSTSAENKKAETKASAPEKGSGSKTAERSGPPTLRRRRSVASPAKIASPTPVIAKVSKGQKPMRRIARAAAAAASNTMASGKNAAASASASSKPADRTKTTPEQREATQTKRPRGRPRKDGSWPVSRGGVNEDSGSRPSTGSTAEVQKEASKGTVGKTREPQAPATTTEAEKDKAPAPSPATEQGTEVMQSEKQNLDEETPSKVIQGDIEMQDLTERPTPAKPKPLEDKTAPGNVVGKEQTAPESSNQKSTSDTNAAMKNVAVSESYPSRNATHTIIAPSTSTNPQVNKTIRQGSTAVQVTAPLAASLAAPLGTGARSPGVIGSGPMVPGATVSNAAASVPAVTGALVPQPVGSGSMVTANLSAGPIPGAPLGTSAGYPVTSMTGAQANNFAIAGMKAVPIAPAPVVSSVPQMSGMAPITGIPPISNVPATSTVPSMPPVPGLPDTTLAGVGAQLGGKLAMDAALGMDIQTEDREGKKGFRRMRGRPRREAHWGVQKPVSEEAVEKVKDLNDAGLSFSMGPPGAV